MDKLNILEINDALKDVRNAYRLIALYQKRLLDIIKYVSNSYSVNFGSGWSKFTNAASHGNRASIDKSSWDWLSLYLYEFNLGTLEIDMNKYHFKIVHQADTGYFDASIDKKFARENVEQFSDVNSSLTRLYFVISKNDNGCPIQNILNGHLKAHDNTTIFKESWLAVPFNLQQFSTQSSTDSVIREFNSICKESFHIELIKEQV